jgi:hypothetical protein
MTLMASAHRTTSTSAPLIHIPVYCGPDATTARIESMLEYLCVCVRSYVEHGNDHDLLVTTNDARCHSMIARLREATGRRFESLLVSRDELMAAFEIDAAPLDDPACLTMLLSKFYPIFERMSPRLIHLDFDTVFTAKVDLTTLFQCDLTFANAQRLSQQNLPEVDVWCPSPDDARFFGIETPSSGKPPRSRYAWLNSGLFAVQDGGFELCREEVGHYLKNLGRLPNARSYRWPDEILLNAAAVRRPEQVSMIEDHTCNFLAYYLCLDESWPTTCQILHFHGLKPTRFRYVPRARRDAIRETETWISDDLVVADAPYPSKCRRLPSLSQNEDLHLAVMMWFIQLHRAALELRWQLPTLSAIPLEVAVSERDRLVAKLGYRVRDWGPNAVAVGGAPANSMNQASS